MTNRLDLKQKVSTAVLLLKSFDNATIYILHFMGCKILLSTTPNLTFCFLLFSTKQSSNSTTTSKSFYTILCDSTQHISCSHWQMALNYLSDGSFHIDSLSSSSEPDILIIKSILIMHDPDGRELDCEILLRVIETIMHQATASASQVNIFSLPFFFFLVQVGTRLHAYLTLSLLPNNSVFLVVQKLSCSCCLDSYIINIPSKLKNVR